MPSLCHLESSHRPRPAPSHLTPSSASLARLSVKQDDQSHSFDWSWPKNINRLQVQNLFRLHFLDDATNVVLVGGVGLGKSHLVTALGLQACERGYSVLFTSTIDAINTLAAAKAAGQLKRDLRRYLRPRLLILDELGYLPIDKTGADLLFQIISQRYERGSIAITTNRVFKHWPEIFNHDATLTSAVLDRLLHHAETVTTDGTQSCCLALAWCSTRAQRVCTSIPSTEDADSAFQLCLAKNDVVSRNMWSLNISPTIDMWMHLMLTSVVSLTK